MNMMKHCYSKKIHIIFLSIIVLLVSLYPVCVFADRVDSYETAPITHNAVFLPSTESPASSYSEDSGILTFSNSSGSGYIALDFSSIDFIPAGSSFTFSLSDYFQDEMLSLLNSGVPGVRYTVSIVGGSQVFTLDRSSYTIPSGTSPGTREIYLASYNSGSPSFGSGSFSITSSSDINPGVYCFRLLFNILGSVPSTSVNVSNLLNITGPGIHYGSSGNSSLGSGIYTYDLKPGNAVILKLLNDTQLVLSSDGMYKASPSFGKWYNNQYYFYKNSVAAVDVFDPDTSLPIYWSKVDPNFLGISRNGMYLLNALYSSDTPYLVITNPILASFDDHYEANVSINVTFDLSNVASIYNLSLGQSFLHTYKPVDITPISLGFTDTGEEVWTDSEGNVISGPSYGGSLDTDQTLVEQIVGGIVDGFKALLAPLTNAFSSVSSWISEIINGFTSILSVFPDPIKDFFVSIVIVIFSVLLIKIFV